MMETLHPVNTPAQIGKFKASANRVEGYLDFIDQSAQRNAELAILTTQTVTRLPASEDAVKMLMKRAGIKGELRTYPVYGNWVYIIGLNLH